ncbi:ribonuclease P protein component 4 [Archaeoglobus veneficus]|uniref:Ribonuclease P protein component 4 n=1 Tax=Archaeoglobus veneficus (strain DSM 11195 / SNP6) TaxID=693661 RepID=F2KPX0_ARCVS|nr:ribonuclease P [Archaeoglobus veneficus]AEA46477.1 Ribonuclease P protein component 4 [Archaeoglobus veneficus SNP6]
MLKREKKLEKKIALRRIKILLDKAHEVKFEDYELARRYVELARRIAMKYRLRIPREERLFCKKCLYPYRYDRIRVRVAKSRVIITCLNCGFVRRIPIRPARVIKKPEK